MSSDPDRSRAPAGIRRATVVGAGWLTGIVLAAWLIDVSFWIPARGREWAVAAGVAAAACWISGLLALFATVGGLKSHFGMVGAASGTLFRTGGPLAALAVGSRIHWLMERGFGGQLVVFFLITLAAETVIAVRVLKRAFNFTLRRRRSP